MCAAEVCADGDDDVDFFDADEVPVVIAARPKLVAVGQYPLMHTQPYAVPEAYRSVIPIAVETQIEAPPTEFFDFDDQYDYE